MSNYLGTGRMHEGRRIAKNTIALFTAQIVVALLTIVLTIFIARYLGDVIFGKYSFAIAFTAFFVIFSKLGYETLLVREVAKDRSSAKEYMNNILGIRLILSLIIFVFIIITINLMNYPNDTKLVVYLFGFYYILESLSEIYKVAFRAFQIMEYEAITKIIANIIRVSLSIIVLFLGYGLIEIALIFILSGIFDIIFSIIVCNKKVVKSKPSISLKFFKETLRIVLPLSMITIFSLIYVRADTIMLSILKGDEVVGWYNAAYQLVLGFKPIPHLFMTALFPLMSFYYVSSKDSLKMMYEKSFKYLFILGLPLAVGITLVADKIIIIFFEMEFFNSIIALQILSWDILFLFLSMCLSFVLVSMNKQTPMAIFAGFSALINVVINLLLIPSYSYVGAAVATIASEAFLFIAWFILVSKNLHILPFTKIIIKPLIACGAMALILYYFHSLNAMLLISIAIATYFGLIYVLKGLSDEDMKILKDIVKR